MNDILTPDQIADLAGISQICDELGADLVVIGATSLLILMGDLGRFTRDVDLTVALDFDEFERLTMRLAAIGWTQAPKLEHRWIAPRQTIIDLLPAGAELRRSGSIAWPASQFKMSLAGFEHVFAHAVEVNLAGGTTIRVAPPIVTALLKIIAWVDDQYRRAKVLPDIRIVLRRYEQESERLFSFAEPIAFRAMPGIALRHHWQVWRQWQCAVCNLQIPQTIQPFESLSLRQF